MTFTASCPPLSFHSMIPGGLCAISILFHLFPAHFVFTLRRCPVTQRGLGCRQRGGGVGKQGGKLAINGDLLVSNRKSEGTKELTGVLFQAGPLLNLSGPTDAHVKTRRTDSWTSSDCVKAQILTWPATYEYNFFLTKWNSLVFFFFLWRGKQSEHNSHIT